MAEFHTIVVGAGSGGLTVAIGLSRMGKRVALIEKQHVGGDCTNVGCVPSKTLIHLVNHQHQHGLSAADILAKVRQKRDDLRDEESHWVQEQDNLELIPGEAKFINASCLEVNLNDGGQRQLKAKNIVLATGSRPIRFPIKGVPEEKLITNEEVWELAEAPHHLAIVGAGVIGSELAIAFRKLGSQVSLIDLAPRMMSVVSEEASEVLHRSMLDMGIAIYTSSKGECYDNATQQFTLDREGEKITLPNVDRVMLAVGRAANLDRLGLEQAGVKFDRQGIPTNRNHRSNVQGIYAIGDITLSSAFTHSANAQGRRLVQHLAYPFIPLGKEKPYPSATFSQPEIATIGLDRKALNERFHPQLIKTLRHDLKDTDRGYTMGLEQGYVKVHVMSLTGRILGAEIVAPAASEMLSILTLAVYQRLSLYSLFNMVYPYPVLSEALKKISDRFVFETLPKLPQELIRFLRYRWSSKMVDSLSS